MNKMIMKMIMIMIMMNKDNDDYDDGKLMMITVVE